MRCGVLVMLAFLPLAGCQSSGTPGPWGADLEWIDLSYTFDETTIYWPTSEPFRHEVVYHGPTSAGYFYSSYNYAAAEHGGTHMDAPIHFAEGGWTVDEIPVDRLLGPACVVDVREECTADRDYALPPGRIRAWESEHGRIPAGAVVLLLTGWGEYWPDRKRYLGDDRPGKIDDLHFPGYSPDAARLLADRGVAMVGLDTASLDPGPSTDFASHVVFCSANIPGLENVADLDRMPPTGGFVLALPMKIGGGSGGPVRILGLASGGA